MAAANVPVKVVVLCQNSAGEPEFYLSSQQVSAEDHDLGLHYEQAKREAESQGYQEPMIAFDKADAAAKQLAAVYLWM